VKRGPIRSALSEHQNINPTSQRHRAGGTPGPGTPCSRRFNGARRGTRRAPAPRVGVGVGPPRTARPPPRSPGPPIVFTSSPRTRDSSPARPRIRRSAASRVPVPPPSVTVHASRCALLFDSRLAGVPHLWWSIESPCAARLAPPQARRAGVRGPAGEPAACLCGRRGLASARGPCHRWTARSRRGRIG